MITFDHFGEVITAANCHFTMYSIKYYRLDYIRASYSVYNMLVGSKGDLGCLMAQVFDMIERTVIICLFNAHYFTGQYSLAGRLRLHTLNAVRI